MQTFLIMVLAVLVVAAVTAGGVWFMKHRRASERRLRQTFGSEYDRTLERTGDEAAAQRDLAARLERRDGFDLRDLDDVERGRYVAEWEELQRRFVDHPGDAVVQADRLVQRVMRDRGYPVEDFDQRARDLSVDHPEVVEHYRESRRLLDQPGQIDTEDQRGAMLHVRELFEQLVGAPAQPRADR